MRIRAAATQFGYLLGAVTGGLALAAGGCAALGARRSAALFVLAALPRGMSLVAERRGGAAARAA